MFLKCSTIEPYSLAYPITFSIKLRLFVHMQEYLYIKTAKQGFIHIKGFSTHGFQLRTAGTT